MSTTTRTGDTTLNQKVGYAFGAIYIVVGILGFFVSDNFISQEDNRLLGIFMVNHLHNIVHLLIGLALLGASKRHDTARSANLAIGATYLLLGVLGPVINGSALDIIALNGADNVLHLVLSLGAIGAALASKAKAEHDTRSTSTARA